MTQRKRLYNKTAAGQRIRSCRERLGLSRQKMAEQIGKAEKYYADIERGYCGMSGTDPGLHDFWRRGRQSGAAGGLQADSVLPG